MKIILTRDVLNVGRAGDVKKVAAGYARNYLIPNGLAVLATPGALKEFKLRRSAEERREEKMAAHAEALAEQLSGVSLAFEAKAGEKGRLYGSITTAEIAEALERATGLEFDRRKQILSEPLREVGEHVISIRLSADVVAEVKATVRPEGGELPGEAEAEASTEPTPEEPTEASTTEA